MYKEQIITRLCAAAAALVLLAGPGSAAAAPAAGTASDWTRAEHARVRLVSGANALGADGAVRLGLEFRLAPGWKVYWRAPGDAGVPPRIDWSGTDNLAAAELRWPVPERFTIFGLTTFVYGDRVILPIEARAADPARPLDIAARVSYLVCEKICIPHDAELSLTVAPGAGGPPSVHAGDIARYAARVPPRLGPEAASRAPFAVQQATLVRDGHALALEVLARAESGFESPDVFVEAPPSLRLGPPEVELGADRRRALLRLPVAVAGERTMAPEDPRLTLTLVDRGRAVEQTLVAETAPAAGGTAAGIAVILGLAFLGGLILNLMPCVLPVLSIKVLSVVGHGGGDARAVRRGFLSTAAGIVASFWVLAAVALALKAAGAEVGWGIQFQEPLFLAAMATVVTLFAANLFGLFEIPLPGFAAQIAGRPEPGPGHGLAGAFATGAFATLLATPCSAPFLGTAVGFALSRGSGEIIAVFTLLGLGLAFPYLVVAARPRLATALPRPGPWMTWLRRVLGVALLGTGAWLVSVLWAVSGLDPAAVVAAAMIAILAVLGLRRAGLGTGRRTAAALVAMLAAGALAVPALVAPPAAPASARPGAGIDWRPFDRVALRNHVAEGRVVFVDVTADWCVTCQANKALVIDREPVAARLRETDVVAMRADWTRPDPAISAYLRSFGRFGIPFNAVYGPGAPSGIVLGELLTRDGVLDALERAGGSPARAARD